MQRPPRLSKRTSAMAPISHVDVRRRAADQWVPCAILALAPGPRRADLVLAGCVAMVEEMRVFLAISLGGILGANARYIVALYVAERFGAVFPYGTFLINVTGSLVIGFFL